jgi:dolichol kinase
MISKKIKREDTLYYNRKFVHILAGGIVTLFVPFYSNPFYPLLAGFLLTIITYISHRRGGKLYWFQSKRDFNDVNFCLMWGISIFILWSILDSPWLAIMPAAFMAFGDGITGIVRNWFFKKRFKHPIGNVFMAAVCIPIGYVFGGYGGIALGGVIAAIIASITERYEFGYLDDNILITFSSSIVLIFYKFLFSA